MNRAVSFMLLSLLLGPRSGMAQDSPAIPQHIVVKVDGSPVTFKRPEWSQFAPMRFGTVLGESDLVNLGRNASATIVCDGFLTSTSVIGPGIKPVPCNASAPSKPTWWKDVPVIPSAHIDLPSNSLASRYVMASTFETKPTIHWMATGADSYTVRIIGDELDWTGTATTNSMMVGVTLPPHDTDKPYEVSVKPVFNKVVRPMPELTGKFAVISPLTDGVREAVAADLGKLGLPAPVTTFLKARLFARYGDYDAAITFLQGLRGSVSEPALGRTLGDVYAAKGSLADAEQSLADAATLYEKEGDTFGRAITDEAIALVQLRTTSKRSSALARLKAALKTYQTLGDSADAIRVQTLLAGLQGPTTVAGDVGDRPPVIRVR